MSRIAEQAMPVTGGAGTHADVHVAAVVGRVLGTGAFPATAAGYRAALAWMSAHGELARAGVEGTGSYGAGLARLYRSRTLRRARDLRFGRLRGLRQDRGSCLSVCCI